MDDDTPKTGEVVFLRPTMKQAVHYSEKLAAEIAETYATEPFGIKTLCKRNKHWPTYVAIFYWRLQYPEFDQALDMARLMKAAAFVDEAVEIADDESRDRLNGEMNPVAVRRDQLRAAMRIKWAEIVVPERYGPRVDTLKPTGYLPQDEAIKYLK